MHARSDRRVTPPQPQILPYHQAASLKERPWRGQLSASTVGLGSHPGLAQDGHSPGKGLLVSAETCLGSQARFSSTSHHNLLFLISVMLPESWGHLSVDPSPQLWAQKLLYAQALSALPRLGSQDTCPGAPGCKVSFEHACVLFEAVQAKSTAGGSKNPSLPPWGHVASS